MIPENSGLYFNARIDTTGSDILPNILSVALSGRFLKRRLLFPHYRARSGGSAIER